jgi:long-chain acyl-CoA synthetase
MGGMIFLTGATGFLGSRIARLILDGTDHRLAVLVRGESETDARRRLERAWHPWFTADHRSGDRVSLVRGDLSQPLLGIEPAVYDGLVSGLTHIIHSAAELQLDGKLEEARRINVGGTTRILELAKRVHRHHALGCLAHVSTAYVAGRRAGEVSESDLSEGHGFSNAYERTKWEGERLVRQAMASLPVCVFRPGMIVGDSVTGEIQSFNTVYVPLRLYLAGKLRFVPARPDLPINIIPVDYVAEAIARLMFDKRAVGRTFHLTADRRHLPSAREFLECARYWAVERFGRAAVPARFFPLARAAGDAAARKLGVPASLLSYFNERRSYRRDNTDALLGSYVPDWGAILPRLFDYAADKGFLRNSGRTVHEQLLNRLQSKRLPVRIHDIVGTNFRPRGGDEMCREIRDGVEALRIFGVTPGDRVALVGINSSRFLSLDTAIGLAGAVSVPLYSSAPAGEIDAIISTSGARLLLVGVPSLLSRVVEIRSKVTIVSFCDAPAPVDPAGSVVSWETFIGRGAEASAAERRTGGAHDVGGGAPEPEKAGKCAERRINPAAPVTYSDLATIRFTSGTTGDPKGAMFRHGQLFWLAETTASILPWKARITPARYLSFLPLNHVVEGILGMYSPAYIPAPVDIFFLDDFHALPGALRKVRPTVFFSIPRFYEKLWSRFSETPPGRFFLSLPSRGPGKALRNALRPLLRSVVLRQAGLDKCSQLIAGSAPCPEGLLERFRELGIEIHNAYGLTEAPLVALNRRGSNRLGTVGLPLPETQVRIAVDGEVLVRGPQVTAGYCNAPGEEILRDGWLSTGDLGRLDERGGLTIRGRKKEILITSYGKNIHPGRIEEMLREIPGMADAMIVGDNRPLISALLWLANGSDTAAAIEEVDRSVHRLNGALSRPERVKRWAILADGPTIENGELTGNLKLRRQTVLARRADVVAVLYSRRGRAGVETSMPGVLHFGMSIGD